MAVTPRSRADLQVRIGFRNRDKFRASFLIPLIDAGLLTLTLPGSRTAPNQRYLTSELGLKLLEQIAAEEVKSTAEQVDASGAGGARGSRQEAGRGQAGGKHGRGKHGGK